MRALPTFLGAVVVGYCSLPFAAAQETAKPAGERPFYLRAVRSGPWSDSATWSEKRAPKAGERVYVPADVEVRYDVAADDVIRSLHLDGTLRFADDRSTRLCVGLIRVGANGSTDEQGFDCVEPAHGATKSKSRAALLVGDDGRRLPAEFTATIRLTQVEGLDPQSCPSIVCCGGRVELWGSQRKSWTKLAATAAAGSTKIVLAEPPVGWRPGDRLVLTATTRQNKIKKTFRPSTADSTQTEERFVASVDVDGSTVTLDRPLEFEHAVEGEYRGDVANLTRNVVVESADPAGVRGHVMFHAGSACAIQHAEFRHLGKDGTLGRYSLHFHLAGDTMRGSSVVGASIWDSHNRWITVHGTNFLVLRDVVGYRSRGHGFFLEDGTEMYNVLDRNLAVQAYIAKPLPKQVLPYDKNDGSGFWWANCGNSFTRNVAADCDEYGYFFQATKTPEFDPVLTLRKPDGTPYQADIRTVPFVRFEDNEAHCQRRHSFNLGGGVPFGKPNVEGVGPDAKHPFVVRNLKLWNVHWGIHPVSPSVLLDGVDIHNAEYGIWRPEYRDHAYRRLSFDAVPEKNFYAFTSTNRAPNDESAYPTPLSPIDDRPPTTVVTGTRIVDGKLFVSGTTSDDGDVARVVVNGKEVESTRPNFAEWSIVLDAPSGGTTDVAAHAVDKAGNVETTPHRLTVATGEPQR